MIIIIKTEYMYKEPTSKKKLVLELALTLFKVIQPER